jgi:hypothetical protein
MEAIYSSETSVIFHRATVRYIQKIELSKMSFVILSFFVSFSGWGETKSTWYVGHCWPIVPAPDDR